MIERWKDITGWEGIYQISNSGRIKSFKRDPTGYIMSLKNKNGDYLTIVLCQGTRPIQSCKVHILVATYFVPNPDNKPEVNHRDLDRQNNQADNLEWVTPEENRAHAIENGVDFTKGLVHYNKFVKTKWVLQLTLDEDIISVFQSCKEAERKTGVCARNIHLVASKTEYKKGHIRSQAGGYRWKFVS